MKPSALNDHRTRRLALALDGDFVRAWGLLEGVWHFAAQFCPSGVITTSAHPALAGFLFITAPVEDVLGQLACAGWCRRSEGGFELVDWMENRPMSLVNRVKQHKHRLPSRNKPGESGVTTTSVTTQVVKKVGGDGDCHQKSDEQGVGGKEGGGVSEDCAQNSGETYHLGTKEAKPPKKATTYPPGKPTRRKPPLTTLDIDLPPGMDDYRVHAALEEWITYRRKSGKPYRDKAYVAKTLAEYADEPPDVFVAAVNYSIGQGYQGLFRAGEKRNGQPSKRPQLSANAFDLVEKELGG